VSALAGTLLRHTGSFAVRAQGDTFAISRRGNEGWIRQLATMRDTVVERMWEPVVQVHGPKLGSDSNYIVLSPPKRPNQVIRI
jgi:hypothetical protein